jgi:hypothetical protein
VGGSLVGWRHPSRLYKSAQRPQVFVVENAPSWREALAFKSIVTHIHQAGDDLEPVVPHQLKVHRRWLPVD